MAATPRYVPLQNETLYIMEEASLILFCFTWMVREFMLPLKNALLIKFFLFFQHACFFWSFFFTNLMYSKSGYCLCSWEWALGNVIHFLVIYFHCKDNGSFFVFLIQGCFLRELSLIYSEEQQP